MRALLPHVQPLHQVRRSPVLTTAPAYHQLKNTRVYALPPSRLRWQALSGACTVPAYSPRLLFPFRSLTGAHALARLRCCAFMLLHACVAMRLRPAHLARLRLSFRRCPRDIAQHLTRPCTRHRQPQWLGDTHGWRSHRRQTRHAPKWH